MFYFFPRVVSKKDCKYFIKHCLKNSKFKDGSLGTFSTENFSIDGNETDLLYRKTDIGFLKPTEDKIHKTIYSYIIEANRLLFNYKLEYFQPVQFARYKKDYFYDWHQDFYPSGKDGDIRKLSLTLSLSDPDTYDGGCLEFFNRNQDGGYSEVIINEVKMSKKQVREEVKAQGSIIVFDSNEWHRVTPITKGIRYSIVCWAVGPTFV